MTEDIINRFSLKGKISVVVGGAGLLGKAIVKGLAEAGARVYIGEIDKKKSENIKSIYQKEGLDVEWMYIDISKPETVKEFIEKIVDIEKKIDIWINCAYPRTDDWGSKFEEVKYDSLKKNVDMHLNGYFLCCQQICKQMRRQKKGSLINFGSIYGLVGPDFKIYENTDMTVAAAYSLIKGGIVNFTRYLASYYGKYGIRINAICPGGIYDNQAKSFLEKYEKNVPLGRIGNSDDIVGPVIFLSSDAASYITGHILTVDGGWTAI